jgi:hypothetical protein
MKTAYLTLAMLFAGCLDTSEEIYFSENTVLTTDVPMLDAQTALIQYSGFHAYPYTEDGVDKFELYLDSSRSPFACSSTIYNSDNLINVRITTEQALVVGTILPIEDFWVRLASEDYTTNFFAEFSGPASPDSEGSLEITEATANSLSGIITARISGSALHLNSDQEITPDEVNFTLNINSAPSCDSFVFGY